MSILDNMTEMSDNNVTIAENQQAVYNAGMRAGLAQDPDYSEGYKDGYNQGATDASGIAWDSLLNGDIPVGKAKEADLAKNAKKADLAAKATNSDFATRAASSETSDHATNADTATEAGHADLADLATEATHAGSASHSDRATYADGASHATTATSADTATTATVAKGIEGKLPVSSGGTGAADAAGALNALGAASIVKGYYIGTGEGGVNTPNTLAFDREVKLLILFPELSPDETERELEMTHKVGDEVNLDNLLFLGGTEFYIYTHYTTETSNNLYSYSGNLRVSVFSNTISWYIDPTSDDAKDYYKKKERARLQRNKEGCTYHYIAFLA
jgi:hypothetical protein